jgi:hypothetical protein
MGGPIACEYRMILVSFPSNRPLRALRAVTAVPTLLPSSPVASRCAPRPAALGLGGFILLATTL